MHPFYVIRLLGGVLFFAGMAVMAWNLWKTVRGARPVEAAIPAPAHEEGLEAVNRKRTRRERGSLRRARPVHGSSRGWAARGRAGSEGEGDDASRERRCGGSLRRTATGDERG